MIRSNCITFQEKTLYHQIHPAKLFTDWSTGLIALYFLWRHDLAVALLIGLVPPVVASLVIMQVADLEKYRRSRFGQYVRKYMTRAMEAVRLAGYLVMALGVWDHVPWLIPAGLLIIAFGWLRGVIFRTPS